MKVRLPSSAEKLHAPHHREILPAHEPRSSRRKEAHSISGKGIQSLLTSAASKRHGFTLIELMVVVVLIGIMTAMIIPEMKGTFEDALLRSTARKLVNILNLAYSQAVTVSQPHRVRLDRKSGHYVMERTAREGEGAGGFVPVRNVIGSEGELDTRISIDIRKPDEDQAPATDPDPSSGPREDAQQPARSDFISFNPDGTADDKEIILRDREGFRLALRINPTTARVRIIEPPRE